MKFKIAAMFVVAASECLATMNSTEVADAFDLAFRRDMSFDGVARPRRLVVAGIPFPEAYSNLIERTGWTSAQIEEAVISSVSNRCTDQAFFAASRRNATAYRGAVEALARHCVTNALPALEYAFLNSVRQGVADEAFAIVDLSGTGHDAFGRYGRLLTEAAGSGSSKVGYLSLAVSHSVCDKQCPVQVTNRVVRFFLDVASVGCGGEIVADKTLCAFWGGYASSSNRYCHVMSNLAACESQMKTNYLHSVKLQLESLPPGTMQMLSTNQFYNAED